MILEEFVKDELNINIINLFLHQNSVINKNI